MDSQQINFLKYTIYDHMCSNMLIRVAGETRCGGGGWSTSVATTMFNKENIMEMQYYSKKLKIENHNRNSTIIFILDLNQFFASLLIVTISPARVSWRYLHVLKRMSNEEGNRKGTFYGTSNALTSHVFQAHWSLGCQHNRCPANAA